MDGGLFGGLPAPAPAAEPAEPPAEPPAGPPSEPPAEPPSERPAKRARAAAAEVAGDKPASTAADAGGAGPPGDEAGAALERLRGHVGSRKKFAKAAALAVRLLEGGALRKKPHGEALYGLLAAALADPQAADAPELRRPYRRLFKAALDHAEVLPLRRLEAVNTFCLRAVVRPELHSDDSFAFNKAAARVKDAIDGLPAADGPADGASDGAPDGPAAGGGPDADWVRAAVVDCIRTAHGMYRLHAWARTTTDMLTRHALMNRAKFREPERKEVQRLWQFVKGEKVRAAPDPPPVARSFVAPYVLTAPSFPRRTSARARRRARRRPESSR